MRRGFIFRRVNKTILIALIVIVIAIITGEAYEREHISADEFLDAVANVACRAREEGWQYGDSMTDVPCGDGLIACDRLISRALWDLGMTKQMPGGWDTAELSNILPLYGFRITANVDDIVPGTVVIVSGEASMREHSFVVVSYDRETGMCSKYDMGSQDRIESMQPFEDAPLIEWEGLTFYRAYIPENVHVHRFWH